MRQAESLFPHQGSRLCPLHWKHRVREFLNLTFILLLPAHIRLMGKWRELQEEDSKSSGDFGDEAGQIRKLMGLDTVELCSQK